MYNMRSQFQMKISRKNPVLLYTVEHFSNEMKTDQI